MWTVNLTFKKQVIPGIHVWGLLRVINSIIFQKMNDSSVFFNPVLIPGLKSDEIMSRHFCHLSSQKYIFSVLLVNNSFRVHGECTKQKKQNQNLYPPHPNQKQKQNETRKTPKPECHSGGFFSLGRKQEVEGE